jgi:peptide/nickel transport system ATP-binding protein
MYAGRIMENAPIDELFDAPQHPYSQGLLGSTLSVHQKRETLSVMSGAIPNLTAPPSGCRFHPRCEFVMERCSADEPPLFVLGEAGQVASRCWLHDAAVAATSGSPGRRRDG